MIGIGGDSQNPGPDIQNVVGLGLGQTAQQPRSIPNHVPRPGLPIFLPFFSFILGFSLFLTSLHVEIKSVTHMVFYPKVFSTICTRNTKTI
jgi:hypothetical protein